MRRLTLFLLTLLLVGTLSAGHANAGGKETESTDAPEVEGVTWDRGPATGELGKWARIRIPAGFVFADGDETRTLQEKGENISNGREQGFLAPADLDWFVIFEYDDTGHVQDDEKTSLDADAMIESIRKGNEKGNEERRKRGWSELKLVGWETPPKYNEATHNLEWALRGESEGKLIVNHNTRRLGREGVMRIVLVAPPDKLASVLPKFEEVMGGFDFSEGNRYAEYRQGDKLAKYGLSALVVGGGAAAVAKAGGFKYLWKGIGALGIAAVAFLKRLFTGKRDA